MAHHRHVRAVRRGDRLAGRDPPRGEQIERALMRAVPAVLVPAARIVRHRHGASRASERRLLAHLDAVARFDLSKIDKAWWWTW